MEVLFETERLRVRKFELSDAERLYLNHFEELMRTWIPNECYADVDEAEDAACFYRDCMENGYLPYVLAVELKKTGELIGDVGVNEVEGKPREVEIGYSICEKYSGCGYASEVVNAMTKFVSEKFGIHVLYGRVLRGNRASVRVLEKNGYRFAGEETGAEDDPYGNGMLIYKKLT